MNGMKPEQGGPFFSGTGPSRGHYQSDRIMQKISGRKWAEEVQAFAMEDSDGWSEDFCKGFWQSMRSACDDADPQPKAPSRPTMDDDEAKHFEMCRITFGAHEGKTYADVPTDYLQWICENGERLASYLRSDIGQRRQGEIT